MHAVNTVYVEKHAIKVINQGHRIELTSKLSFDDGSLPKIYKGAVEKALGMSFNFSQANICSDLHLLPTN